MSDFDFGDKEIVRCSFCGYLTIIDWIENFDGGYYIQYIAFCNKCNMVIEEYVEVK